MGSNIERYSLRRRLKMTLAGVVDANAANHKPGHFAGTKKSGADGSKRRAVA
jgi:hypothetical protein